VLLIRHCQSANNALINANLENAKRSSDPGLTALGESQSEALRDLFREKRNDGRAREAWTSPMRRCLETSRAIARGLEVRVNVMVDLHEHGGCFDGARGGEVVGERGMTKREIEEEFPGFDVPATMERGWWSEERGCESVSDAQRRVEGVADWLWTRARAMASGEEDERELCVVAHGMFIDILLKTLFDAPRTTGKQRSLFCSQNACVHKLHFDVANDGACVGLQSFNDVSHIPECLRSGGSVEGLDVAYTHEGSA